MNKFILIIGLFQVLTVVVGVLAVRLILKMSGYPDDVTLVWNPASIFLRDTGIVLLLFPILWVPLAAFANHPPTRGWVATLLNITGLIILIGLVLFCCWGSAHSYTRPVLTGR